MAQSGVVTTGIVGYHVHDAGGRAVGSIEGVRERGVRIHDMPGHLGHHGYLPQEAIARIDPATDTVHLREGVTLESILDAPPPPDSAPDGWHMSSNWWADLLGHYGLYDAEGKGNAPFLHADSHR